MQAGDMDPDQPTRSMLGYDHLNSPHSSTYTCQPRHKAYLPVLSHLMLPKPCSSRILKVIQEGPQGGSLGCFQHCRKPKGDHAFT